MARETEEEARVEEAHVEQVAPEEHKARKESLEGEQEGLSSKDGDERVSSGGGGESNSHCSRSTTS
jgi:hypothetical protein